MQRRLGIETTARAGARLNRGSESFMTALKQEIEHSSFLRLSGYHTTYPLKARRPIKSHDSHERVAPAISETGDAQPDIGSGIFDAFRLSDTV